MQIVESDVLVVGYGSAGAAAAITAHDRGAKVVILEKTQAGGGNSRLSGGILFLPKGPGALRHVETLCFGKTDSKVVRAYVDGCRQIPAWIEQLGGKAEPLAAVGITRSTRMNRSWPNVPGVEDTEACLVPGKTDDEGIAEPLWRLLAASVERRKIEVLTSTPAKKLVTNADGQVVSVVAERDGKQISMVARKAVVLASGGFEYNDSMKDTYLPLTPLYAIGHPGNTGDGLTMTQQIGAAMWHMNQFYGWFVYKAKEYQTAFTLRFFMPSVIYVDSGGRRFTDEMAWEAHEASKALLTFMPGRLNYPCLPAYAIFDDEARRKGPVAPRLGARPSTEPYTWSLDNSREIARGWIKQGRTIGELAQRISVDEATLKDTVDRYNEACKAGRDADFGRSRETLGGIEVPPYYAIEMWPGIGTTCGGPRRDEGARVLREDGQPIPRLYAAGGLGTIWGFLTLVGGELTDAIVFGRIAGENAARETPW